MENNHNHNQNNLTKETNPERISFLENKFIEMNKDLCLINKNSQNESSLTEIEDIRSKNFLKKTTKI